MSSPLRVGEQSVSKVGATYFLPPEFWWGVEQFNQQLFYECHDTLEALWMEAGEPEKKFYQGVLQIAVACHHLGNHNYRGAVMLLGEGTHRLLAYTPADYGVDVTKLVEQSTMLLEALQLLALRITERQGKGTEKVNNLENPADLFSAAQLMLMWPRISGLEC